MTTMSLKLEEDLSARLAAVARRRGESRSAVAREALRAYLDAAGKTASPSCLELMADLAGCVSGPGDLSTNPNHMEGYGK